VRALTWPQVNAWRLSQHCLFPRMNHQGLIKAVTQTGGIQAQVMSAAELALSARVDGLSRQDIQRALWEDHTLIKTWAMRGTLHLISAEELPLYAAARGLAVNRSWATYFAYYGITLTQQQDFLAAVPEVLGSDPMTREELATAAAGRIGVPKLRDIILSSSWGSPLKLSAFRGDLCFGPNQGQNVTFVNPKKWTGKEQPIDSHQALQEVARRYLRAYGPATPAQFARWWGGGSGLRVSKKAFEALEDELEPVEVEGWRATALSTTLEQLQQFEGASSLNLLPFFDAYTFGFGRSLEPILAKAYETRVFRPQGWISAVVLVDGCMQGVWEHKIRRSDTIVKIHLFSSPTAAIKKGIEAEAERLAAFLNTRLVLEYEAIA
jgi:winged helix DNA-binding protein